MWKDMERCFQRAFFLSFTKKKFLLVFPVLVLCGILVVFCRAMAFGASNWISMSMTFLPMFLSSGILISLGVFLIRIYHHEVKHLKFHYRKVLASSWELIIGTSYFAIPSVLLYLLLWICFGIFLLLKEIPFIGPYIGVVLAFAPFLLILISLVLVVFNLGLLFFISPAVALKPMHRLAAAQGILVHIKKNLFTSIVLFLLALFPLACVVGLLSLAAVLTGSIYLDDSGLLSVTLQWFFIMIPFCAILTFPIVFFFQFAAETYNLMRDSGDKE